MLSVAADVVPRRYRVALLREYLRVEDAIRREVRKGEGRRPR